MGAHQCPMFLVWVLAALDSCYLQSTESQVLPSTPSTDLPNLLTRLGQMPDYSMFKDYIIKYDLSNEIEVYGGYTIFAPNNDAIERYLQEKGGSLLNENQIKHHIVLGERLFTNDLHSGMHRETMLGSSYQVGLSLHGGQLYVNDAAINITNMETNKGVIHGLSKVMEIQKNRCDVNDTVIEGGTCESHCWYSRCPFGTTPTFKVKENCFYDLYVGWTRVQRYGCSQICLRTAYIKNCCLGFFSQQCLPCPGKNGKPCMGNGVCLDGINGTGECRCEEGFNGTACEMCVQGKYGTSCNQVCSCVHGKCSEGTDGDGSCECDIGWRGVHCDSEIRDDKCSKACHTSANCLENPDGTAYCKCAAGFKGNGKICTAVDACETGHGGCSAFAQCKKTTPGNRLCVCNPRYSGDGLICLEINPCLVKNGGCDVNAECTQTGANQSVCNCFKGYSGNGTSCESINPCRIKNGGCSHLANCNHTGPGERVCTCRSFYVGDGVICRGRISKEIYENNNISAFYFKLQYASVDEIGDLGSFTVFVPTSAALINEELNVWTNSGRLPQVLRFHIVACDQLMFKDLATMTNVTSLQGDPILIKYSQAQNTIILNNNATIISSDIVASNGIMHIIDQVLFPPNPVVNNVKPLSSHERIKDNITKIAEVNGYTIFWKLLQDADLLSTINSPLHTPVTLFWLSDKTIKAMPQEQQDYLFSQDNRKKLVAILKFHIIPEHKIFANDFPKQRPMRTLQGNNITVKCGGKGNIGDLIINDGPCKIVQRRMEFDNGITYGIDCLLNPDNVGGHCHSMTIFKIWGECISCYSYRHRPCPSGFKSMGVKQDCSLFNFHRRQSTGCQEQCGMVMWTPECCRGYYGRDCQACPGGSENPCSSRGICDDELSGTGECKCNSDFNGTSCELCVPGKYGPECKSCKCSERGQCDDGVTGSGQCICDSGWVGAFCETKLAEIPVCSPKCSSNAICQETNRCVCRTFYEGDGFTCTVLDLCSQNNGGCAQSSTCSQSGVKVTCSCQKGYKGDGYVCLPIDACVEIANGGCHEHAICTMTGPGENKCDCKENYIGDGKDCEEKTETVDRCLQDNGECHANADCTDFHYQDATVGVFHLRSPKEQSKFTYNDALKACADRGATLATYNQLSYAQKAGFHLCVASWLDSARVAYPSVYSSPDCGSGFVGIMDYGITVNLNETWDVFCYRMKEVKCTCKDGYVGDGYMCNGNLLQVLTSFPMFSRFTSEILRYFNHSAKGQEFVTYLTNKSIQATMFAPNNDVMGENETLSGQDIEYHLLNGSIIFYEDLINTSTLHTRIGHPLQVTYDTSVDSLVKKCRNQTCFVEGRTILEWDIYATNGIIHVISRPLRTPPVPMDTMHPGVAAGIFFIILAVLGLIIFAVYIYSKSRKGHLHFQKLRANRNMDALMLDNHSKSNHRHKRSTSAAASPSDPTYNALLGIEEQQLVCDEPFD